MSIPLHLSGDPPSPLLSQFPWEPPGMWSQAARPGVVAWGPGDGPNSAGKSDLTPWAPHGHLGLVGVIDRPPFSQPHTGLFLRRRMAWPAFLGAGV